jgi:hypothetical protein
MSYSEHAGVSKWTYQGPTQVFTWFAEVCMHIAFPTMSQQLYQDYNRYLQFFVPSYYNHHTML